VIEGEIEERKPYCNRKTFWLPQFHWRYER